MGRTWALSTKPRELVMDNRTFDLGTHLVLLKTQPVFLPSPERTEITSSSIGEGQFPMSPAEHVPPL